MLISKLEKMELGHIQLLLSFLIFYNIQLNVAFYKKK